MDIAGLWRYPVKSLGGERLHEVDVTATGLVGDRVVHVRSGRDQIVTARTAPKLLALRGTWDAAVGEPLVNGTPWRSAAVAQAVREAAGSGARLVRFDGVARFDVLPLSGSSVAAWPWTVRWWRGDTSSSPIGWR